MTESTNPEHGTEQASSELPIPTLAPSSDGSPSVDIDAIANKVAEKIQREIRMAQSTKDKEIDAIKKRLKISELSELEELGVQIPDNVKLEYRLRQIENGRLPESSTSQSTSSPGNGAALTAADVSEVVKKFQLDANSPEVIEKLRGTYRSRDHFEATMATLALARTNPQPPSPAGIVQAPATGGAVGKSIDALTAQYQKDMIAAKGDRVKLRAVKEKAIKDGVPVDRIAFV